MGKPKPKPTDAALPVVSNETVDRWIGLRAQRTAEIGAYTSVAALFLDFEAWHTAEYPDAPVPAESAFSMALVGAYKIRIERLPVQVFGESRRLAACANLLLREAIRAKAA